MSEWNHFGGLQFLFAGAPLALVFSLLDDGVRAFTQYSFQKLGKATIDQLKSGTRWQILYDTVLLCGETL